MNDNKQRPSIPIIAAIIGATAVCIAAIIELFLPFVDHWADAYFSTRTPQPIAVSITETMIPTMANLIPTEILTGNSPVTPTATPNISKKCSAIIYKTDIQTWEIIGSTDKGNIQAVIDEYKEKILGINGFMSGFNRGDTLSPGLLLATDFGNGESEFYLSYPVKPIVHYRSWGLFEVMVDFIAPSSGWCATISP